MKHNRSGCIWTLMFDPSTCCFVAGTWAYFATIATSYMFTLVPFVSLVFGWHPVTFSRPFALASTAYLVSTSAVVGVSVVNGMLRKQECR
jgi:hypothetical protein